MERRKVDVTAYAGYRSGEKPRSFVLEGQKIVIAEIISQWVEEVDCCSFISPAIHKSETCYLL